jgi:N-acetylglucosaminyl-diphospho-decaprenol L-rhamnosyltransferase
MDLVTKGGRSAHMDVLAVIVAYNSEAVLSRCVTALAAAADQLRATRGTGTALVVVDNASRIPASAPNVGIPIATLRLGQNLGFAPAANLGAEQGHSRLILFLNPDAELERSALTRLVEAFDEPLTAVAGPLLVRSDGEPMVSERPFHTLRRELRTQLLASWSRTQFGRRSRASGRGRCLTGACMLVERRFFESVGGLDVSVRMYLEDVELCWQARAAGRDVRFVPQARCVHGLGDSSGGENFDSRIDLHLTLLAARVEFVRRRSGRTAAAAMRGLIAVGAIGRTIVALAGRRDWHRHIDVLRWATTSGDAPPWNPHSGVGEMWL